VSFPARFVNHSVLQVVEKRVGPALVQDQIDQLLEEFAHKTNAVIFDPDSGVSPRAPHAIAMLLGSLYMAAVSKS
jgi:hypothetical protein